MAQNEDHHSRERDSCTSALWFSVGHPHIPQVYSLEGTSGSFDSSLNKMLWMQGAKITGFGTQNNWIRVGT